LSVSGIFGLAVPPLTIPGTVNLPKLPGGLSPGSIVITVLAGIGTYLQTQAQPQPDPVERAKKQQEEDKEDNKHVVKMLDVAKEIDNGLNSKLLWPIVYRAIINTIKPRAGQPLTFGDLTQAVSDAEWDPIREELKRAIRTHLLQQKNTRKTVTEKSFLRIGKLHK
jgi:hypothetical protein